MNFLLLYEHWNLPLLTCSCSFCCPSNSSSELARAAGNSLIQNLSCVVSPTHLQFFIARSSICEKAVAVKWTGIPSLILGTLCEWSPRTWEGWVVEPLVSDRLLYKRLTLKDKRITSVSCRINKLAGRQRSLSGDPTTPSSRKRDPKEWTYSALNNYFGGSLTEAASHLATQLIPRPEETTPFHPFPL